MQAPFGLGKSGDSIYLFDKRTILVDRIDYAVEDDDTASIGRWENGEYGLLTVFQEPTPGAPNRNPRFGTGYLRQPPTLRIPECVSFSYTNVFQAARPAKFEFRVFPLAGGQLPQGLFFDQTSGVLSWTPSEEQGPGLYQFNLVGCIVDSVNVTVCDHLLLTLMVEERPSLPEIDPIASITVDEGALVEFNVNARRSIEIPHYETFTNLRLEGDLSVAAEFDQQSGAFRWQTDEIDGPGVYHIRVIAEDSTMPEILTESVVSVTVNEVNQPFTYLSPKTFYLWNNESFATHLKVSDPDLPSNKISYVVITKPAGCTLNIDSGLLSWQPAAGYAGSEKVRLRIYDNAGASQLIDVTLAVAAMNLQTDHLTVEPDGTLKMQWLSRPDTTYLVEWSPTLEVGEWRTLNAYAPVVGTGSQIFYIIDPAQSDLPARAFFRLKQQRD